MIRAAPNNAGHIILDWTGTGLLEWSPGLQAPWTRVIPSPIPPYVELIGPDTRRFYRLVAP